MRNALAFVLGTLTLFGCAKGSNDGFPGAGGGAATGGAGGAGGATGADAGPDGPPDGPIACLHASDCVALADACNSGSCLDNVCVKSPLNEGGACDDGLYCTSGDVCTKGLCMGTPKVCPGVDDCHVGACDEATKTCLPMPGNDGASCTPTDMCFTSGSCFGGACLGTVSVDCSFLTNACNTGTCDSTQGCKAMPYPDMTACPGSLPPTACSGSVCLAGVCSPSPINEGGPCNDGLFCTINDHCQAGTCVGGGPNLCAPPGGCFVGVCSESAKSCTSVPGNDGAACTDGDVCNTGKTCKAGACTNGTPANDGMACASGTSCVVDTTCMSGVCGGGTGPVVYFADDFHDASKGWTLDPEWQIGPAKASTCQSFQNPDPALDHSPSADNGVAGIVIGGCETPTPHAYEYITSPAFDTSTATGSVILGYYRFLNSDYSPYMHNAVDVYDGTTWVNLWTSGSAPGIADTAWTYVSFDVTAHKSATMRVRFGYDIGSSGVFTVSSWNLDDVLVASAPCP